MDALVLIMSNDKTNQTEKIQYATAVRNKDPLLCPLGAFVFYLFFR